MKTKRKTQKLNAILERIHCDKAKEKDFSDLYDICADCVYSHAFHIARSQAIAEDIVQETMLAVWKMSERYNEQKGSPLTWILTIAHNKTIDYIRKEERNKNKVQALQNSTRKMHKEFGTPELNLDLKKALAVLSSSQTIIINLAYYEGHTHEEIAEKLEVPLGTVKSQLYAALKSLRYELEGYNNE